MRETVFIVHIHIFEDEVLDDEIQRPSKTSVTMYDAPLTHNTDSDFPNRPPRTS